MKGSFATDYERLRLALDAANMGDWSWAAATDVITFSDRAAQILGILPNSQMSRTKMRELLHEDDRNRAAMSLEKAITEHRDYDIEYRLINTPDELRWVSAKGRVLCDENGNVTGMIGVVQDITAHKQQQEELERAARREQLARLQAEESSRLKDEFLTTVSHELRTPLNSILGWTSILRRGDVTEDVLSRALEIIERNARSQTQLVDDLLDVSRIITGRLRLNLLPVTLPPVIQAAIETVRPAAEGKGIDLQTAFDADAAPVAGDAERLQQVVWNLLSNAIKFTPRKGRIKVRLRHVGSYMEITISDDGQGISRDFLPYIFDRFRQADSSITRKQGGMGLGLALVRYLVEMHGGMVQAQSDGEGCGATFTIRLPILIVREVPNKENA